MTRRFKMALCFFAVVIAGNQSALAGDLRFVAGPIPPYVFKNDGFPDGAATAVLDAIARELQIPFQLEFQPWMRAQITAQKEQDIGIIPLSRTPERESLYKWVGPLIYDREVLVTLASNMRAPANLDEGRTLSVCVLRGSPGETRLRALGYNNLFLATDTAACAQRLAAKKVDAWSVAKLVAPYQYKLEGLDPATLSVGAEVRPNDIYLGFSMDVADEVVSRWQKSLDEMRANGKLAALLKPFQ